MLATKRVRNDYQFENTIGRMDRKIYILAPTVSTGDSNEDKIDAYTIVRSVKARIENETGDTEVKENQIRHIQSTRFTIRYRYATDVTIKHRVVYNNKMYAILSVIEKGEMRKRFSVIAGEYDKPYVIT